MSRYLDPDLDGREAGHITGRWGVEAQENRSGKTASKADALFWVLLLHLFKLLLSRKKKVTVCKMTLTLITFSYGWYLAFWAPLKHTQCPFSGQRAQIFTRLSRHAWESKILLC